jgi:hypothetical protein
MGIIANVDSTDFTFTAGTGVTSLILGADPDAPGTHPILDADKTVVATPTVNAEPGWVIDLTNAAAASTVTITDAVVFTDGDLAVILDNTGTLVFDGDVNFGNAGTGFTPATGQTAGIDNVSITGNAGVGGNIRVTADSSVDFSSLQHLVPVAGAVPAHLVSDLTLTGIDGIALDAGALVRMTDAQFAAQALTFSGAGQTLVISQEIFDKIDLLDGVNDNAADLTQLRGITAIQIDDAVVTGTLLMTPAEAAVATAVTETAGAYATQTWDHDSDVTTAKVDRVAGDFRGIDALINIQVAHAADISALRGVDQIDVIDATPASLKISAEQVTPLGDGNETSYANEVAALSSLSISITYQQGIDSDTGVPLPVFNTRDVVMTVSHDATTGDVTTIATTGHVAAVGRAQTDIGANFDTLMALSDTVNLTFVGSFASTLVNTAGTPDINLYAGVVETLSFVQTPYLSDWTLLDSATEIHGFLATSTAGAALDDKLGLNQTFTSAATATGAVAVVADVTAAAANANGTVYALDALINTSATDLVTIDAAVLTNIDNANLASSFDGTELLKALVDFGVGNTASGIQVDTQGDSFYLAVTQGAFSYLYMVDSNHDTTGGANNGVAAANEIALIAVFDTNIDLIGASKTIIVDI